MLVEMPIRMDQTQPSNSRVRSRHAKWNKGFLIYRPRFGVMHGVFFPIVEPLLEADSSNDRYDTPEFETNGLALGMTVVLSGW